MPVSFQITIDCADPDRLVGFWATALGYRPQDPPSGHASWSAYWRSIGVPDDDAGDGPDAVIDPEGAGPRIWFQQVPEAKLTKNRLHLDIRASGGRSEPLAERKLAVQAKSSLLEKLGARRLREIAPEGLDHYAIVMLDPEGNEFCIN